MRNQSTPPRILIGLHGLAETGKSTAARALCHHLELRKFVIARPVTQACAAALGMPHEQFLALPKNAAITPLGCTKRQMMQQQGDALIEHNPRALINLLEHRMAQAKATHALSSGALIEDVRTEAEAAWVRDHDGIVIHIRNSRASKAPAHRTEAGVSVAPLDIVIKNEGTRAEFDNHLKHIANTLRADYQLKNAS